MNSDILPLVGQPTPALTAAEIDDFLSFDKDGDPGQDSTLISSTLFVVELLFSCYSQVVYC